MREQEVAEVTARGGRRRAANQKQQGGGGSGSQTESCNAREEQGQPKVSSAKTPTWKSLLLLLCEPSVRDVQLMAGFVSDRRGLS